MCEDARTYKPKPIQFICINTILSLCLINSSKLDVGIIASVCGLPHSPSYLKFELRPSWNNIHDTLLTGTAQDTAFLPVIENRLTKIGSNH